MSWRIGEILIQKKLLTWDQLKDALEEQERTKELIGEILIRKGLVHEHLLYKALAEQYVMRFVDLSRTRINPKAVALIPKSVAQKYNILPIELYRDKLTLGIGNPIHLWPEEEIKQLAKVTQIDTVLCVPTAIRKAIEESYHQVEVTEALSGKK
ncbi:MAG: hypothetical protein JW893_04425 [Candidatus Omnitrophica bacterium]|nr:hypothetical protein [Candidatus Omnitrophota bacterium]